MKLSRQHFRLIADVLADARAGNLHRSERDLDAAIESAWRDHKSVRTAPAVIAFEQGYLCGLADARQLTLDHLAAAFADVLAGTNGLFRRETFLDAAGPK